MGEGRLIVHYGALENSRRPVRAGVEYIINIVESMFCALSDYIVDL